ncbi:MAG: glycosyltransferase family A protein [Verrucomicrobiota bacterium]
MIEVQPAELDYVLITPARNEAALIEHPLRSVIAQTMPPQRWIIVSDSSSDGTDDLVKVHAKTHPFITLVRRQASQERNFASKVEAIRLALKHMPDRPADLLGFLDADVSFAPFYFEEVLKMFALDARLGIAGGQYYEEHGGRWRPVPTAADWSVTGGVQMFRTQCYSEIGGYIPRERGGIDTVAEVMARQRGWKVRTNTALVVHHHRRMGLANQGVLRARFLEGWQEYTIGYDPAFAVLKSFRRVTQRPWAIGSISRICGFFSALVTTSRPTVPDSMVSFLRAEQRKRLIGQLTPPESRKGAK